jgi:DNA/RNA endonuclease G (NUC1)
MTDIFLSYSHIDRERLRPIVELLEDEGWSVWWDRGIEPGMQWLPNLKAGLRNCKAVVVAWSETSIKSNWVHREAEAGISKGSLVPILLDKCRIPSKFSEYQTLDLSSWKGEVSHTEIQTLFRRLAKLVPPSRIDTVRPGYETKFLGSKNEIRLPAVSGSAAVLRYNHFTVVMNPARRLAHYTAYNMHGRKFVFVQRHEVQLDRDQFRPDPLIPNSLQINMPLTISSGYNRGHLMARTNVCWGEQRKASISSRQAFYWTNIAPQFQQFNVVWWLKLEQWERKVAIDYGKATGFSGPVFSDDDPPLGDNLELEDGLIVYNAFRIPRAYWKVVFVATATGKLKKATFLMDQFKMRKSRISRDFDLSDYHISLKELEEYSRVRFDPLLHECPELKINT